MPFAIDARSAAIRHTRTPWALRRYRTLDDWQQRAIGIRRHILACAGLSPLPEKTPLKPRIFGRIERADYTVEKVFFREYAGFLCLRQSLPAPGQWAIPRHRQSARALAAGAHRRC